jgi:hypothetical protein
MVALMGALGVELIFSNVWLVAEIGEQREGADCKKRPRKKSRPRVD